MIEPMTDAALAKFRKLYTPDYHRPDRVAMLLSDDLMALLARLDVAEGVPMPDMQPLTPEGQFIERRLVRVDVPTTAMQDLRQAFFEGTLVQLAQELRNRGFKTEKRADGKVYVNARLVEATA